MKSEDIAKLAGVSRSTVSRVINNYPNVPEETRIKVMEVINAYNYMPNTFARTLAGKKSNTLGVFFVITGAAKADQRIFHNDFFASYLDAIVDIANAMGYYVLVQTVYVERDYDKVNQAFLEKRIDGGMIIGTQDDTLQKIRTENINSSLVIFDYEIEKIKFSKYNSAKIFVMNSSDYEGIESAVDYLVELGHKEIGFVKGNEATLSGRVRFDAYKKVMRKHKLTVKKRFLVEGDFYQEVAYENMKAAIANGDVPTAYICANDYMAFAVIQALNEAGYNVPEDVSIIGFDNTRSSQQLAPRLTTIAPSYYEMAKKAVEMLDAQIQETQVPDTQTQVPDTQTQVPDTQTQVPDTQTQDAQTPDAPNLISYAVELVIRDSCQKVKTIQK